MYIHIHIYTHTHTYIYIHMNTRTLLEAGGAALQVALTVSRATQFLVIYVASLTPLSLEPRHPQQPCSAPSLEAQPCSVGVSCP